MGDPFSVAARQPDAPANSLLVNLDDARLLTDRQVADLLAVDRRSVWRLVAAGNGFPAPITIGVKSKRWRLGDIVEYVRGLGEAE